MAQITQQITKIFDKGMGRDAVQALGIGTIVNVVDKKYLNGKLATTKIDIPNSPLINGKTVNFNGTDALMLVAAGALSLSGKKINIIKMATLFAVKKFAELSDFIDPYEAAPSGRTVGTVASLPTRSINYSQTNDSNLVQYPSNVGIQTVGRL